MTRVLGLTMTRWRIESSGVQLGNGPISGSQNKPL
jgi:hypothetical protein